MPKQLTIVLVHFLYRAFVGSERKTCKYQLLQISLCCRQSPNNSMIMGFEPMPALCIYLIFLLGLIFRNIAVPYEAPSFLNFPRRGEVPCCYSIFVNLKSRNHNKKQQWSSDGRNALFAPNCMSRLQYVIFIYQSCIIK